MDGEHDQQEAIASADHERRAAADRPVFYTCNGSRYGCERERFGMCVWHDLQQVRPHREQIAAIGRKILEIDVPSGPLMERVESVLHTAAAEILRIAEDA